MFSTLKYANSHFFMIIFYSFYFLKSRLLLKMASDVSWVVDPKTVIRIDVRAGMTSEVSG